jgi:glycyl-tRNA synthetase beta chain
MADQIDKLAGFLGLGFVPTGSSDPYGLRRAATLLIEAAWAWPSRIPSYGSLFEFALKGFVAQGFGLDASLAETAFVELLSSRYESLIEDRYDIVQAAMMDGASLLDPRGVRFRVGVLRQFADDTAFINAATRPANIVQAARKKGFDFEATTVDSTSLQSETGDALWSTVRTQRPLASQASQAEDVEGVVLALRPLQAVINAFFDSTMVMVDDAKVRDSRLKLLSDCESTLRMAGDFTKLVIEG